METWTRQLMLHSSLPSPLSPPLFPIFLHVWFTSRSKFIPPIFTLSYVISGTPHRRCVFSSLNIFPYRRYTVADSTTKHAFLGGVLRAVTNVFSRKSVNRNSYSSSQGTVKTKGLVIQRFPVDNSRTTSLILLFASEGRQGEARMKLFIHGLGDNNKSIQVSNPIGQAARNKSE